MSLRLSRYSGPQGARSFPGTGALGTRLPGASFRIAGLLGNPVARDEAVAPEVARGLVACAVVPLGPGGGRAEAAWYLPLRT